jgi:hypothetical protein
MLREQIHGSKGDWPRQQGLHTSNRDTGFSQIHSLNDFQRSTSASLSNFQGEYHGTSADRYTVA